MLAFKRMGVVLEPRTKQPKTIAKFNAGMVLDGETVHLLFRYAEWRKEFDPECMSCYAKDEIRYARLTPQGRLLEESPLPLLAPSLPGDTSGCQDPRIVPLDGWYYITYCGWNKDSVPAGQDKATLAFARTRDFKTAEKLGVIRHYTWDKDHFLFPGRVNGKVALVIARLPYPVLEPVEAYERVGDIPTVVFPVGAYIHDGQMVISYGAADRVTALASAPVAEILDELRRHRC